MSFRPTYTYHIKEINILTINHWKFLPKTGENKEWPYIAMLSLQCAALYTNDLQKSKQVANDNLKIIWKLDDHRVTETK